MPPKLLPPERASAPQQTNAPKSRSLGHRGTAAAAAPSLEVPYSFENAIKAVPLPSSTRERILYAAVSLLHEEGFASLTQARVCERAGVRQSHLTYYFPTRNDLLRETAVFGCEALLDTVTAIAASGSISLADVRERLFVADESDRRFGRLMAALIVASDEDANIKPWLASFEKENRTRITALLRAANASVSDEDVELLHAAYVGAVMLDIGEASDASLARAQRVVHRAFDAIVAETAAKNKAGAVEARAVRGKRPMTAPSVTKDSAKPPTARKPQATRKSPKRKSHVSK
jgi:AcrR family transcriptional regulator